MTKKHLSSDIDDRLLSLITAIIHWERMTGRQSVLIFRENNGEAAGVLMSEPGFEFRAVNGIPLPDSQADIPDDHLLKPFRFAPAEAGSEREALCRRIQTVLITSSPGRCPDYAELPADVRDLLSDVVSFLSRPV